MCKNDRGVVGGGGGQGGRLFHHFDSQCMQFSLDLGTLETSVCKSLNGS